MTFVYGLAAIFFYPWRYGPFSHHPLILRAVHFLIPLQNGVSLGSLLLLTALAAVQLSPRSLGCLRRRWTLFLTAIFAVALLIAVLLSSRGIQCEPTGDWEFGRFCRLFGGSTLDYGLGEKIAKLRGVKECYDRDWLLGIADAQLSQVLPIGFHDYHFGRLVKRKINGRRQSGHNADLLPLCYQIRDNGFLNLFVALYLFLNMLLILLMTLLWRNRDPRPASPSKTPTPTPPPTETLTETCLEPASSSAPIRSDDDSRPAHMAIAVESLLTLVQHLGSQIHPPIEPEGHEKEGEDRARPKETAAELEKTSCSEGILRMLTLELVLTLIQSLGVFLGFLRNVFRSLPLLRHIIDVAVLGCPLK